jgi:Alpha/beta hydrolase domain
MNRQIAICITALGVVTLGALGQTAAAAAVPNPTVIGPIPATAPPGDPSHNYPFFSTTVDLAKVGYAEEEFFFEGTANRYNATGSIIDSGHPYRTRMVVRRPASPVSFNGTVLMEWQNVTAGYDLDGLWAASYDHIIRRGYVWIGVSAQRVGIHQPVTGLKAWSPSRYGTLDVTQGGTIIDDALAYDIFSQAAQAVRSSQGVDPMEGLQAERVLAIGVSQSANRLVIYHNSIHLLAGIFDAFFLVGGGGLLRTDLDVKAFKVLSETDVATLGQAALRQPDSDRFRRWEVAGAAHLDFRVKEALTPLQLRDIPPPPTTDCDLPPLSRIPYGFVVNAAYDHVVRWMRDNIEPSTAPEIELFALGPPVGVSRDTFGNALGGIRLSQHAVPTATNTGVNSGPGFCRLYGSFQPFDDATLNSLYPNHGTYVSQVTQTAHENLKNGFVVLEDAIATVQKAAQAGIGKQ